MRVTTKEAVVERRHREATVVLPASPSKVFGFVDDHARFSSHMGQSSWMMAGSRMAVELDAAEGRAVGAHIRMSGRILGVRLFLDEVITRRQVPTTKVWSTVGTPRLLVIGAYTMGVEIAADGDKSRLRVFIDFDLPSGVASYWLGALFGGIYAAWCVKQMTIGAAEHFWTARSVA